MKKASVLIAAFSLLVFGMASCDRNDDATSNHDTTTTPANQGDSSTPTGPTNLDTTSNSLVGGFDQNGASNAVFTVAKDRTVHFSQGNLQYRASDGTWRFAAHQYEYIGATNSNISAGYSRWIDLFGWGTSGWVSGAVCYQPWSSSTRASDYNPSGGYNNSLIGENSNADWGVYNPISNGGNCAGMWRTLTYDEWHFLFYTRANATSLYGLATIDGLYTGLVILPDSWNKPSGLSFISGINGCDFTDFSQNQYTIEQWEAMESAGAIFLPAAGYRTGTGVSNVGDDCLYWSSSGSTDGLAYCIHFDGFESNIGLSGRYCGYAVRLVMD